ncbi:uncharacterized protein LOC111674333 [Orussus abietinus]|uniref:uncharacterized protein LOC111674333 n=1 Tax=Orussus abietinus TaxID=222816 RepID=UPI000C7161AA|nr:uncharacterized protein LOC111674333 [Orussus abietinus]
MADLTDFNGQDSVPIVETAVCEDTIFLRKVTQQEGGNVCTKRSEFLREEGGLVTSIYASEREIRRHCRRTRRMAFKNKRVVPVPAMMRSASDVRVLDFSSGMVDLRTHLDTRSLDRLTLVRMDQFERVEDFDHEENDEPQNDVLETPINFQDLRAGI